MENTKFSPYNSFHCIFILRFGMFVKICHAEDWFVTNFIASVIDTVTEKKFSGYVEFVWKYK